MITVPYFVFTPSLINILLIASLAIYNGVVFFLIYSLSNPFSQPLAIQPTSLQLLFNYIQQNPI